MANFEMARLRRYRHPFTVAYLDCDNFKIINDGLGHQAGNDLLKLVAIVLKSNIRQIDVIARIGGDEFVILMPETNQEGAPVAIDRLRGSLIKNLCEKKWDITLSIGVATFYEPANSVEELLKEVDEIMYLAKKQGKNRIEYRTFGTA